MKIRSKSELGFIKFIVLPLWETLNKYVNEEIIYVIKNI